MSGWIVRFGLGCSLRCINLAIRGGIHIARGLSVRGSTPSPDLAGCLYTRGCSLLLLLLRADVRIMLGCGHGTDKAGGDCRGVEGRGVQAGAG